MNKKLIAGVVLGIVAVGVAGALLATKKCKCNKEQVETGE